MERKSAIRDVQPPVTTDQELAGYRSGLATFNAIVAEREAASFASRDDPARLEDARQELYRVYRKRQGLLDTIATYERQQSAQQSRQGAGREPSSHTPGASLVSCSPEAPQ